MHTRGLASRFGFFFAHKDAIGVNCVCVDDTSGQPATRRANYSGPAEGAHISMANMTTTMMRGLAIALAVATAGGVRASAAAGRHGADASSFCADPTGFDGSLPSGFGNDENCESVASLLVSDQTFSIIHRLLLSLSLLLSRARVCVPCLPHLRRACQMDDSHVLHTSARVP
jgi:hypothetical protein